MTTLEDICTCEIGPLLGDGRPDSKRCTVHDMTREELVEYAANGWREVAALEARVEALERIAKIVHDEIGDRTHGAMYSECCRWWVLLDTALLGEERTQRPTIVCLCGSTRFMDAFHNIGWAETLAGRIVLSVGVTKHIQTPDGGHSGEALGPEVAAALDELHKRKIDLADEILVLDVGGYVGESTRSEIDYARRLGKRVRWLSTEVALRGEEER